MPVEYFKTYPYWPRELNNKDFYNVQIWVSKRFNMSKTYATYWEIDKVEKKIYINQPFNTSFISLGLKYKEINKLNEDFFEMLKLFLHYGYKIECKSNAIIFKWFLAWKKIIGKYE